MPWENHLVVEYGIANRLPTGFKTFDFYDETLGLAVSAKTIDTLTGQRLANPKTVYYSLKKDIDSVIDFEVAGRGDMVLNFNMIRTRRLEVAIPEGTTPAQLAEIIRAVDYEKINNIDVVITKVK